MTSQERKSVLLARQYLTEPADRETVVRGLNGLQAQYLKNVRHGLEIRCCEPLPENWGDGLVKAWTLRGTMHVFSEQDLPLYLYRDRNHFLRPVDKLGADEFITAERKQRFAAEIVRQIEEGNGDRERLRTCCCALGMTEQESQSVFDPWGGTLRALAEQGTIAYRAQEKKEFLRCPDFVPMERDDALREILRRCLTHLGPVTLRDLAYFLGKPQREIARLLEPLAPQQMAIGGQDCLYLGNLPENPPEIPDCLLLAGFDPLMLSYEKTENPFLPPEYLRGIFTMQGIVHAPVLLRGTVAGRWKRQGRRCIVTCFRSFYAAERTAVMEMARRHFPDIKAVLFEEG